MEFPKWLVDLWSSLGDGLVNVVNIVGGGLVGFVFGRIDRWGRKGIDQYSVTVVYLPDISNNYVRSIMGTVMFYNRSGHDVSVKIVSIVFDTGDRKINLRIRGNGILPQFSVQSKGLKQYEFFTFVPKGVVYPVMGLLDEKVTVTLNYIIGNSSRSLKVKSKDLNYEDERGL